MKRIFLFVLAMDWHDAVESEVYQFYLEICLFEDFAAEVLFFSIVYWQPKLSLKVVV